MYRGPDCDDERKSTPTSGDFCSNRRGMYRLPEKLMKGKISLKQNIYFRPMYRPWEVDDERGDFVTGRAVSDSSVVHLDC